MKRKILKCLLITVIGLLCVAELSAQQKKHCTKQIIPCIEVPRENESGEKYFSDTLRKSIRLIFEKDFNDSIIILLNGKVVFDSLIVTAKGYGAARRSIDINYSTLKKPTLYIIKKNGECIWFYLKRGQRVAYINYSNQLKIWGVELSNIQRHYL